MAIEKVQVMAKTRSVKALVNEFDAGYERLC